MSFLSLAWRDRFRRRPVRERSSRSLLVRRRSSSTGRMRSCSRATRLSTEAHCRATRDTFKSGPTSKRLFYFFTGKLTSLLLTLLSPAVMFCSAPAAASRVVELISHCCSTRLYNPTICGCHSHSTPFGTRATSVKVERSWFILCSRTEETRRHWWDGGILSVHTKSWGINHSYILGFPALRCKATNGFARPWVLISGWSFKAHHSRWRHLTVQLVGEVPQDTHWILHPLVKKNTHTHSDK